MQYSQRILAPAILALAGLSQTPAFANVLKVAPTGAPYTQIQTAVNAASDGDVILISAGSYSAVTINGKSLSLCKKGTAVVTLQGTTTVTNLAPAQLVVLSGLRGFGTFSQTLTGDAGAGLIVANNAGQVRVEYCNFYGAIGWGDGQVPNPNCCDMPLGAVGRPGGVIRNNSQGVSMTWSRFEGGRAANSDTNPLHCVCGVSRAGGDGVRIESTLVSLYDCSSYGGRGGDNGGQGGDGGAGCRTTAGAAFTGLFASGSIFQGGVGGHAWDVLTFVYGGAGGSGLFVATSTMAHLIDNTYLGGTGGPSAFGSQAPGANGAQTSGGGSMFHVPESRIRATTEQVARAGTTIDLQVSGTPGQDIKLLVSRAPTFQILPSWRGTLLSQPGKGSVEVALGRIPANGVLFTRYVAPALPPGLQSMTVFVQPYRDDPVLGPKLGTGSSLTLVP